MQLFFVFNTLQINIATRPLLPLLSTPPQATKDKSGQGWDVARDAFSSLWRSAARSPEDVVSDAWERWQETKADTGETWDEAKAAALRDWESGRRATGLDRAKATAGEASAQLFFFPSVFSAAAELVLFSYLPCSGPRRLRAGGSPG